MTERTCPKCAPVGRMKRVRSSTTLERWVKMLIPFRVYACSSCGYQRWMWSGFRNLRGSMLPVGLFLAFVFVCIVMGWLIAR